MPLYTIRIPPRMVRQAKPDDACIHLKEPTGGFGGVVLQRDWGIYRESDQKFLPGHGDAGAGGRPGGIRAASVT